MTALTPGAAYLDSSALAKLYLPEPGSEALNAALRGRTDLWVAELAVTEVVSALCRRRREGVVSASWPEQVWHKLRADMEAGIFRRAVLTLRVHGGAERLLLQAGDTSSGLRALDALHLALALDCGALTLACYDQRLRQAARAAGLKLFPQAV